MRREQATWTSSHLFPSPTHFFCQVIVNPKHEVAESDFSNNALRCQCQYEGHRIWLHGCHTGINTTESLNYGRKLNCTTAWRYILPLGIASWANSFPFFFCLVCRWRVWGQDRVGWGSTTETEQQLCLRQIFQKQLEFPRSLDLDLLMAQSNPTRAMVESKQLDSADRFFQDPLPSRPFVQDFHTQRHHTQTVWPLLCLLLHSPACLVCFLYLFSLATMVKYGTEMTWWGTLQFFSCPAKKIVQRQRGSCLAGRRGVSNTAQKNYLSQHDLLTSFYLRSWFISRHSQPSQDISFFQPHMPPSPQRHTACSMPVGPSMHTHLTSDAEELRPAMDADTSRSKNSSQTKGCRRDLVGPCY